MMERYSQRQNVEADSGLLVAGVHFGGVPRAMPSAAHLSVGVSNFTFV
jgi:hypothetical protein